MIPEPVETRCPGPSRFWEVAAGGAWEVGRAQHVASCVSCQEAERAIQLAVGRTVAAPEAPVPGTPARWSTLLRVTSPGRPDYFGLEVESSRALAHRLMPPAPDLRSDQEDRFHRDTECSEPTSDPESQLTHPATVCDAADSFDHPVRPWSGLPDKVGDYEFLQEIGQGGMGVVYRVRDVALNRCAALKLIRLHGQVSGWAMDRFFRAARLWARLHHPSIVPIYYAGEYQGMPYLVSQLINGETLSQITRRHTRLAPRKAAEVVAQVADAAHYAHQNGVLHRDIKPSNIMIDADGRAMLIDFGLARCVASDDEASLSLNGEIVGTPTYMSPEQARGQSGAIGPASDVYGLGATLYAILAGRPPIQGRTIMETISLLVSADPSLPARLDRAVPRDLAIICLKSLAKDPGSRYTTALALAEDLRRFLAGEPIQARPSGALEQLAWRLKRRPLPFVMGLMSLAFLAVFACQRFEVQSVRSRLRAQEAMGLVAGTLERRELRRAVNRQSEAELRKAVALAETRLGEEPGFDATVSLASIYRRLGDVFVNTDRLDDAKSTYEKAAVLFRRALQARNGDTATQFEMAAVLSDAGETALALSQTRRAIESYREAIVLQRQLVADHPEIPAYRDNLARTLDRMKKVRTSISP